MIKNLIFDLDGTLLETLPGITLAINEALKREGYAYSYSVEETKDLIGGGADRLVKKALREKGDDPIAFASLKAAYMPLYGQFQKTDTKPFPGLAGVLDVLRSRGVRLFVVSNKPDPLAKKAVATFLPPLFEGVLGQRDGFPPKPNPASTLEMMGEFRMKNEETLYVGDSHFDIETAHNAHLRSVLVTWGYGSYDPKTLGESDYVIHSPASLYELVESL